MGTRRPLVGPSVGGRGVVGISRIPGCTFGATVKVSPPSPPPPQQQHVMFALTVPSSGTYVAKDMAVWLGASGERGARVRPSAVVVQGTRWHYFFLGVPATGPVTLKVDHPKLRTVSVEVPPIGGAVQELPDVALQERGQVKLTVDYEPLRTHRSAVIEAYFCGTDGRATAYREVESPAGSSVRASWAGLERVRGQRAR